MLATVRCVSTHPEDLADGRTVEPLGRADLVDLDAPHNQRLVQDRRIIVESTGEQSPSTVKAILATVGDDPEKAQAALDAERSAGEPRSTLVDRLEAIVAEHQNPDEEDSE